MKVLNLVVPIVVALCVGGVAVYLAGARASELQLELEDLQEDLELARQELNRVKQELDRADTSELRGEIGDLWNKIGDLDRKYAQHNARIEKLASAPPPQAQRPAPRIGDTDGEGSESGDDEEDVAKIARGIRRFARGMHQRGTEQQVKRMTEELNLTESQKEDVKKAMSDFTDKMGKAFESGERPDFGQLRKELRETLEQVLTQEQFEKYKEMEENMRQGWGGMRGSRGRRRGRSDGGEQPEAPGENR